MKLANAVCNYKIYSIFVLLFCVRYNIKFKYIKEYNPNEGKTIMRRGKKKLQIKQIDVEATCLNVKTEINNIVLEIKKEVLQCNPIRLLCFLHTEAVFSKADITSECQQLNNEDYACQRAIEYVQSIYISCGNDKMMDIKNEDDSIYYKIQSDIEKLYALTHKYFVFLGLKYEKDHLYDSALIDEIIETQFMYSVRGKRYMVMEKDYYYALLKIHNSLFLELYGMSTETIIEGIIKLQYALTQGKIDATQKAGDVFDICNEEQFGKIEEVLKENKEDMKELVNQAFGIALNDVCKVTNWNPAFVKGLSYRLGEEPTLFSDREYAGWPIIDLPIQKRPFIEIDGKYYCFDYFSFIENFYRAIQKMVSREKKDYQWSVYQKSASEQAVSNIFNKLLPGCTIYQNNHYPVHNSVKQMNENDIIVLYYDVIFIIEVKAGSFVYTAPITDFHQHIKSYKKLIQEPNDQCERTLQYLENNKKATKTNWF